ncbi:cytochrome P450 [Amycolatopsis jiangsuensis]|uniref:Pentalenic acid synthase n=1 Tax=Amycolatopsis jiangsuensis TaxID=1181879 RepID=A0A840IN87_9PSEU|nr:cytochrome P450 [Amycolatopsis jiangsuensis]MBB4682662.1 pentalenic acid synthase [Amycolatopsis jiangsuensis]
MTELVDELLQLPQARTCPYGPPAAYRELHTRRPVSRVTLPNGDQGWLVTGFAETRDLLVDLRVSADRTRPGFPALLPSPAEGTPLRTLAGMDDPEHNRFRRMVTSWFTIRRVRAMRPALERLAGTLVDRMAGESRSADLVPAYCLPLPSMVICELLGVPYADHEFFQDRTRTMITAEDQAEVVRAATELIGYLTGLAADKTRGPGPDLISYLLAGQVGPGRMTVAQLVNMAVLLLGAGHETLSGSIALGVALLAGDTERLAALRTAPEAAVEALVRHTSVTDTVVNRVATADIDVGDVRIRAGDALVFSTAVANRDHRVHPDPDRLDLSDGHRRHVAFGFGVHQCLGQNLARIELEVALTVLFDRLPGLRVAIPEAELPVKSSPLVNGLKALPVRW